MIKAKKNILYSDFCYMLHNLYMYDSQFNRVTMWHIDVYILAKYGHFLFSQFFLNTKAIVHDFV